jgi:hypothetical protein
VRDVAKVLRRSLLTPEEYWAAVESVAAKIVACGRGGIGRRASLRSWWAKARRGSSPFGRTIQRFVVERGKVDGPARIPYTWGLNVVGALRGCVPCPFLLE